MCLALAVDGLMPPDRTQSGFRIFGEVERKRFVFDDRGAGIHLRQFGAGEIRNVIGRLAQRLAAQLFQGIVAHKLYTWTSAAAAARGAAGERPTVPQAAVAAMDIRIKPVLIPMRGLWASPVGSTPCTHGDGNTDDRRGIKRRERNGSSTWPDPPS